MEARPCIGQFCTFCHSNSILLLDIFHFKDFERADKQNMPFEMEQILSLVL